jgi:hypothetical protein
MRTTQGRLMNIDGAIKDLQKLADESKDPKEQQAILNEILMLTAFKDFKSKENNKCQKIQ